MMRKSHNKKSKRISIEIDVLDISHLFAVFKQIRFDLEQGVENDEFSVLSAKYTFSMEYTEKPNFCVEIDEKGQKRHIVKSNI